MQLFGVTYISVAGRVLSIGPPVKVIINGGSTDMIVLFAICLVIVLTIMLMMWDPLFVFNFGKNITTNRRKQKVLKNVVNTNIMRSIKL